jgi:hypothetical protein
MLNYFKAITGVLMTGGSEGRRRADPLVEAFAFFDDTDPEAMRAALRQARGALRGGVVSVWRRAATVPTSVPEVGESPASEVMLPGMYRQSDVRAA